MHLTGRTQYFLNMHRIGNSMWNTAPQKPLSLATKVKAAVVESFLVAKVLLCWIIGLPVFAVCFWALAIWDNAVYW
jgi:hypothetical protein